MSYFTGSAADMSSLRTALIDNAQLAGWAWSAGAQELSKAGAVLYVPAVASNKLLVTGRTATGVGSAPNAVGVDGNGIGGVAVTWPVVWHLHAIGNELCLVINYGTRYQWLACGIGGVGGNPGTGMWVAASCSEVTPSSGVVLTPTSGNGSTTSTCPLPFCADSFFRTSHRNWYVHSNLDGQGWEGAQSANTTLVGIRALVPLLGLLPSNWNSDAVLLPARAYKIRPSAMVSLTAESDLLRVTRNDNYEAGQIISIGMDRWAIYPAYRKNTAARDGGGAVEHSGAFGLAVRYDGP
jgi:hypothetical protein